MSALLLFIVSGLFGYYILRWFRLQLSQLEKLTYSITLGLAFSGYAGLVLSYLLGFTKTSQSLLILLLMIGILVLNRRKQWTSPENTSDMPQGTVIWVLIIPLTLILIWIGLTTLTIKDGQLWVNNTNNYSDIRLHFAYINNFLYGQNFPVENPILSGHAASYPFLSDFIASQYILLGSPLIGTMNFFTVLGFLLVVAILYCFVFRLTKHRSIASLAPALLMLNGGIAIFSIFLPEWRFHHYSVDYLLNTPHDYSLFQDKGYYFGNVTLSLFGTQRALLLGFPLTLIALSELYTLHSGSLRRHYLFIGLVATSLILIHTSSLIPLAVFLAATFLWNLEKINHVKKQWQDWAALFLPIIIIGIPLIALFLGQAGSATQFFRLSPGWLGWGQPGDTAVAVWTKSGLITLPASLLGLYLMRRHHRRLMQFSSIGYIIFFLANVIIFHPWMWDNTKYFLYWYAVMTIPLSFLIVWLWEKRVRLLSIFLTIALIGSGSIDFLRRITPYRNWYPIASLSEINTIENLRTIIEPKASVLTYGTMLNPVVAYLGRRMVFGDQAWLWSHGISSYAERQTKIETIYAGTSDAPTLIKELDIDYVIISSNERSSLPLLSESFFAQRYPLVYNDEQLSLYKVKSGKL